jgi:hypothetical protein
MKKLFVDYENVTNLSYINFDIYSDIYLFIGAKQTKIDMSKFPTQKFLKLHILKIDAIGKDSLDMHISYYLGVYDTTLDKNIAFDILSNDKGYNGIIKYLNDNGRESKRLFIEKSSEINKKVPTLTELDNKIIAIQNRDKGRPKSFSALCNSLKSHKLKIKESDLFSSLRKLSIKIDDNGIIQW